MGIRIFFCLQSENRNPFDGSQTHTISLLTDGLLGKHDNCAHRQPIVPSEENTKHTQKIQRFRGAEENFFIARQFCNPNDSPEFSLSKQLKGVWIRGGGSYIKTCRHLPASFCDAIINNRYFWDELKFTILEDRPVFVSKYCLHS